MANLHILSKSGSDVTVAAHVPIPATNNSVGVPWRTALVNSGLATASVLKAGDGTAGTISAAEVASLASGALYEAVETIHTSIPSGTIAINAYLDAAFTEISARVQTRLQDALNYFGYTRP